MNSHSKYHCQPCSWGTHIRVLIALYVTLCKHVLNQNTVVINTRLVISLCMWRAPLPYNFLLPTPFPKLSHWIVMDAYKIVELEAEIVDSETLSTQGMCMYNQSTCHEAAKDRVFNCERKDCWSSNFLACPCFPSPLSKSPTNFLHH